MNPKRLTLLFAFGLTFAFASLTTDDSRAAFASSAAARVQETTAAPPQGQRQSLAELLRAVEGEGQRDAAAWFRLGLAQDAAGDHDAALKSFRQAVRLRDDYGLARAGVAYVLYEQGKFAEAEKEIPKAIPHVRVREDAPAYDALVEIRTGRQKQEAALELARAERELTKKPDDARWHLRRATALLAADSSPRKPPPYASYFEERPATMTTPDENTRRAAREAQRKTFEDAAASFENYLRLKPDADDRSFVRGQLEALRFHAGRGGGEPQRGEKILNTGEVNAKAVILAKPDPGYTEAARNNGVSGVIRLRAVLAADGQVRHVLVLRGLPDGLSQKAVEAARRIKFRPAVVNGAPVSQWVTLEYNFNVY